MTKRNRTQKQFTEFRRSFKKWRLRWISKIVSYSKSSDTIIIYDLNSKELSRYIAPGYEKYMTYQFRKFKKVK